MRKQIEQHESRQGGESKKKREAGVKRKFEVINCNDYWEKDAAKKKLKDKNTRDGTMNRRKEKIVQNEPEKRAPQKEPGKNVERASHHLGDNNIELYESVGFEFYRTPVEIENEKLRKELEQKKLELEQMKKQIEQQKKQIEESNRETQQLKQNVNVLKWNIETNVNFVQNNRRKKVPRYDSIMRFGSNR